MGSNSGLKRFVYKCRRGVAAVLAAAVFLTADGNSLAGFVYATSPKMNLYINGTEALGSYSYEYGEEVHFQIKEGTKIGTQPEIYLYRQGSMDSYPETYFTSAATDTEIATKMLVNEGIFEIGYDATFGEEGTYECKKNESGITFAVSKAVIEAPTNPVITASSNKVSFVVPIDTTNGNPLLDGAISNYTVRLYYRDSEAKEYVSTDYSVTPGVDGTTTEENGATVITTGNLDAAISKYGYYMITVTANSSDSDHYINSAESQASEVFKIEDTTTPVISDYGKGDGQFLKVTLKDTESGISKYAFSQAETIEAVLSSEWTDASLTENETSKTGDGVTVTFSPVLSGTYYVYAYDADGDHYTKSSDSKSASVITLDNYYIMDSRVTLDAAKVALIGGEEYTLPNLSGERKGYSFGGWQNGSGDTVTKAASTGTDETYTAVWSPKAVDFTSVTVNGSDIDSNTQAEITYKGDPLTEGSATEITLTAAASIDGVSADAIRYNWLKDGVKVWEASKSDSILVLSHVADTGKYKAVAEFTDSDGNILSGSDSREIDVVVNRRKLAVTYTGVTEIVYDDAAPELTYEVTGLGTGDSVETVLQGSLATDYIKGNNAGKYNITKGTLAADDYEIVFSDVELTVNPLALSEGVNLTVTDPANSHVYTGTDIEPESTFTYNGTTLVNGVDYDVIYADNKNVGSACATYTFKGNFSRTYEFSFEITQAERAVNEVLKSGFTYNGSFTGTKPTLKYGVSEDTRVTYYYYGTLADGSAYYSDEHPTTREPNEAGTYYVYAVLSATANYTEAVTPPTEFVIAKRPLKFTTPSKSWEFDGSTHSQATYEMEGTLASGDGLQSVVVTGHVLDVQDDVPNEITVTFDQTTNENNYEITTVLGKLSVTKATLPTPSNCAWNSDEPGTATWTGIVRTNVEVEYTVRLYMHGDSEDILIDTITTTDSSYSFKDEILAKNKGKFYFTVSARAKSGSYAAYYKDSVSSGKSPDVATIDVFVEYNTANTESVSIDGVLRANGYGFRVFQAQTVSVEMVPAEGHSLSAWSVIDQGASNQYNKNCYFKNPKSESTTLTIGSGTTYFDFTYGDTFTLKVVSEDDLPVIEKFEGKNTENYENVLLYIRATDSKELTGYKLWKDGETEPDWTEISTKNFVSEDGLSGAIYIRGEGTYKFKIKDSAGQEVSASETVTVHKIGFNDGIAGAQSAMPDIYAVAESTITIPENRYTNIGKGFKHWESVVGGDYSDKDSYLVEADDTLKAIWGDLALEYTVRYFFMDTDGNYSLTTDDVKTFKASYNEAVNPSTSEKIKVDKIGFAFDAEKTANNTTYIKSESESYVFDVYYSRNKYKLVYKFSNPSTSKDDYYNKVTGKFTEEEAYQMIFFGASLPEEPSVPSIAGYNFGAKWTYEGTGEMPEIMPAATVTATVSCSADTASYKINYFYQNLPTTIDGLTSASTNFSKGTYKVGTDDITVTSSDTVLANHGTPITYNASDAHPVDGFTAMYVTVSRGTEGDSTGLDFSSLSSSASGDVSEEGIIVDGVDQYLNINVYYVRNLYTATLNISRKGLSAGIDGSDIVKRYQRENIAYGYPFTDAIVGAFENGNFGGNTNSLINSETHEAKSYFEYLDSVIVSGDSDAEKERLTALIATEKADAGLGAYTLANYRDWSTGSTPEYMPSGDLNLNRQYVLTSESYFVVDVYLENVYYDSSKNENDLSAYSLGYNSKPDYSLTFYGPTGGVAKISGSSADIEGVSTVVNYSDFKDYIDKFWFYEYKPETQVIRNAALSGTINDTNLDKGNPTHLSVYFDRKTATSNIYYYYYDDSTGNSNKKFATITKTGKWGMPYTVDYSAFFHGDSESNAARYITDSNSYSVKYESDADKSKDFCTDKYVIGYYYRTWTSYNSTATEWNYGEGTLTKASQVDVSNVLFFGKYNYYTERDGSTLKNNYVNVYYSLPTHPYFINRSFYNAADLTAFSVSADSAGFSKGDLPYTVSISGAKKQNYVLEGDVVKADGAVSDISDVAFTIREGNKADIVSSTLSLEGASYSSADLAKYPGLEKLPGNKQYEYNEGVPKTADYYTFTLSKNTEYTITVSVSGHDYVMKVTPAEDITYYAKEVGGKNYIYLPDPQNRLYLGYEHGDLSINGKSYCTGENGTYTKEEIYVNKITSTDPVRSSVWAGSVNIIADYKKLCGESDDMLSVDSNYAGVYEVNNGCCDIATSKSYTTDGVSYAAYYYRHNPTYSISYVIGSTIYRDGTTHASGETVYPAYIKGQNNPSNGTVDTSFTVREGYDIHWYKDADHTVEMPESITMPSYDLVYYGQYEKAVMYGDYYQHYELADPLEIDGQSVRYVTEANKIAIETQLGRVFTEETGSEECTYTNEFNGSTTVTCTVITYKDGDDVVLVKHQIPMITFSDVALSPSQMYGPSNIPVGFYFDMAYPGTTWTGYCQTSKIDFDTYYARDRFVLSVNKQELKNNNISTKNERYGQSVNLENLTRKGYTFEGWNVYDTKTESDLPLNSEGKVDTSGWSLYDSSDKSALSLKMPNTNLYAEAEWSVAAFDYMFMYYFAGEDGNYRTELADKLEGIASETFAQTGTVTETDGSVKDIAIGGETYHVKSVSLKNDADKANIGFVISDSEGTVIGAYEVNLDYFGDGEALLIYYEPDRVESSTTDVFYADAVNAIGASATVALTSEETMRPVDYALGKDDKSAIEGIFAYSPYKYSFASYTLYESVERKGISDEIVISPDMEISIYYGRKNNYTVTIKDAALDGEVSGLTLTGPSSAAYGETITMKENHVSGSYSLNGWYVVPADIEATLFDEDGKIDLATLGSLVKIGTSQTVNYRVKGDTIIYAISNPNGVPEAGVSITATKGNVSGNEYSVVYGTSLSVKSALGYTDSTDPAISMVKTPEVKWYIAQKEEGTFGEFKLISGASGTNLPLDGSLNTGDYKLYCTYTLTRNDNTRSITVTSNEISLKVTPKTPEVAATGYEGQYDGEYHNITINSLNEGATVYYSVDVPFDAKLGVIDTNEAGIPLVNGEPVDTSFEGIRNVKRASKDAEVEAYTVYYYVVDKDSANVHPISGSETVKLTPVQLKFAVHASHTFTKVYNGSDAITGKDKERLQNASNNSFYDVSGWVPADYAELSSLLLDFDGKTNTKHVTESSYATLTNLVIVIRRSDGSTYYDPNYTFDANGEAISVTIPANVEPLNVGFEWSTDTLTYNSEEQAPDISFGAAIPVVNGNPELTTSMIQITGQQKNVGTNYRSYASIMTAAECALAGVSVDADYDHRDYVILEDDASKIYKIIKCPIVITPPDYTTVYNAREITLNADSRIGDIFEISGYTLKENQYLIGRSETIPASAGVKTYSVVTNSINIYETTSIIVKDEAGNDVPGTLVTNITENFDISSATGTMTILKRKIAIKDLLAADKEYDGNTTATNNTVHPTIVDCSTDATYYGGYTLVSPSIIGWSSYRYLSFHESDISADASLLTYTFDNAEIGDNKTVAISYPADIDSILTGSAKSNFTLVKEACQQTTTADITGKITKLDISAQEVTYGDVAPVLDKTQYTMTLLGSDVIADSNKPTLYYKIRMTKDADGNDVSDDNWVSYSNTAGSITGAGTYELKAYFDAECTKEHKTIGNYTLSTSETTKLTVNRKELTVSPNGSVTKVYDGNVNALSLAADSDDAGLKVKEGLYTLSGLMPGDVSTLYIANDENNAEFNSKDFKDASHVTLGNYYLDSDSAKNYFIATASSAIDITANITKRPLYVTADNKEAVYGAPFAGTFTASYGASGDNTGFVTGESVENNDIDVTGILFSCNYNAVESNDNRHAGDYAITPSGLEGRNTDANYSFVYVDGTLKVNKAVILITSSGDEGSVQYGTTISSTHDLTASAGQYACDNMNNLKDRSWTETDGWKTLVDYRYVNSATNESYTQDEVKYAPEGTYHIYPVIDDTKLYSNDYRFVSDETNSIAVMRVDKPYLIVEGLTAKAKVYDGTTVAEVDWNNAGLKFYIDGAGSSYSAEGYTQGTRTEKTLGELKAMLSADASAVSEDKILDVNTIAFDNADVSATESVSLTVKAGELAKDRFSLIFVNTSNSTTDNKHTYDSDSNKVIKAANTAPITKKPLTIKVNPSVTSAKYGELDSDTITYSFEYTGLVSRDSSLDTEVWDVDKTYLTNSNVGTYTISVLGNTNTDNKKNTTFANYDITFETSDITISKNQFAKPSVTLGNTPETTGIVYWTHPADIGNVTVSGYKLTLYKLGDADTRTKVGETISVASTADSSSAFIDAIRSNGEGLYEVDVQAVSSNESNVENSEIATSITSVHAVKVILKAANADSLAGLKGEDEVSTLKFTDGESYAILLAGEKEAEFTFELRDKLGKGESTGYTYKTCSCDTSGVSVGASLDSDTTRNYTGLVQVGSSVTDDIVYASVELTLTDPTLKVDISYTSGRDDNKIYYGYAADSVVFTATPSVVSGDNILNSDYDYTYRWYSHYNNARPVDTGVTTSTYALPTKLAYKASGYEITCVVTATRKDNERSTDNVVGDYPEFFKFTVEKATPAAYISVPDWTYGEKHTTPIIKIKIGDVTGDYAFDYNGQCTYIPESGTDLLNNSENTGLIPSLYFKKSGESSWTLYDSDNHPVDAGAYDMYAYVKGGSNFADYNGLGQSISFKVNKAKYETAVNLSMGESSERDHYGSVSWTLPSHIYEDANSSDKIPVAFHIDLRKIVKSSGTEGKPVGADVFTELKESKKIPVDAVITDYRDVAIYENGIDISENYIATNGSVTAVSGNSVKYVYDFSEDIVTAGVYYFTVSAYETDDSFTISKPASPISYDTNNINAADPACLTADHYKNIQSKIIVTDEGIENNSITEYSRMYNSRPITLTLDAEDGTYTEWQWYKNGDPISGATGSNYQVHFVDESAFYACHMKDADGYEYESISRKITVTKRPIVITTIGANKTYDGTALTNGDTPSTHLADKSVWYVNDTDNLTCYGMAGFINGEGTEVFDAFTAYSFAASQTAVGEIANTMSDIVIERNGKVVYNSSWDEAKNNYAITQANGKLKVTNADLSKAVISITGTDTFTYDGTEHEPVISVTYTPEGGATLTLTEGSDYTVHYSDNVFSNKDGYIPTVTIKAVAGGNYTGETSKTFTINRRKVMLKSESLEKEYDGASLKSLSTAALEDITGTVSGVSYIGIIDDGSHKDSIITVSYTGSNTNAGTVDNTFSVVKITNENNVDVTSDYDITNVYGTLKITKRAIEITSDTKEWTYDGNVHTYKGVSNSQSYVSVTGGSLATGESITSVSFTDAAKVKDVSDGLVDNAFDSVVISKNGNVVTDNYDITFKNGKLSVAARVFSADDKPISALEITAPSDITYTGEALTPTDITIYDNVGGAKRTLTLGTALTGDYYISGYEFNTEVEATGEKPALIITGRGNYTGSFKVNFNILKADQVIMADNLEVVYDGSAHSIEGAYAKGTTHDGNLGTSGISYSSNNTITAVGEKTVTITAAATRNYNEATTTKTLKVTPHPVETLILSSDDFTYDGTELGPVITVKADLGGGNIATLTEGTDYTITNDADAGKQIKSREVGTYTVEVIGKGNYMGTLTDTFKIVDRGDPEVKLVTNGGIYCKGKTFVVEDPNLVSVVITEQIVASDGTKGSETTIYNDTDLNVSSKEYTVAGSAYGSIIKVVATDKSGNTNAETIFIVYDDHLFLDTDYAYTDGKEIEKKAPCDHNCGTYDYIERRWGTVVWEYEYFYSVSDDADPHEGIQGLDARATYAKVELLQNGHVIATQIVDCDATCGTDESILSGLDTFDFTSYDPADPTAPGGSSYLPSFDEHGHRYAYVLKFTAGKYIDGTFTSVNDYAVSHAELYEDTYVPDGNGGTVLMTRFGHKASFSYQPECFDVPWVVTLKNLPRGNTGETIMPEIIYVKVLFAYGPDADDTETASGYQIISQQAGYGDLGVECLPEIVDPWTVTYSGKYPVWKYQGGTTDSYYHRIQIVGYQIEGIEYEISNQDPKLKSINDSDHVNHTIYYIPGDDAEDNGTASGTIRYELELHDMDGAVLLFDINLGGDFTNVVTSLPTDIIVKDQMGDPVTEGEISPNVPIRPNYEFEGWYYEREDGGDEVTSIAALDKVTTLYAHWKELVPPTGEITIGDTTYSDFSDPDDVEEVETFRRSTTVSVKGADEGGDTGVINSGVKALYYYITDTPLSIDEVADASIEWTMVQNTLTVPRDGELIIYLKVEDNDGNVGYLNSKRIRWIAPLKTPDPAPEYEPEPTPEPVAPAKPGRKPYVPVKPVEETVTENENAPERNLDEETPEGGKKGNLEIIVENEGDNGPIGDNTPKNPHVYGEIPNKDDLVNVLTPEEVDKLNAGSDIVIRLTVDDTRNPGPDKAMDEFIEKLTKPEETVMFKTYINLTLEKSIDDSEWERVHESNDKVTVVINIPEGLRKDGEKLVLVKQNGSEYIILEDIDDNPDTITILTDDFLSQYAIVSILDEETAKAYGIFDDQESELLKEKGCFWHWFILLTDIIFIVGILLTLKKKEKEDEEELEEAEREGDEEEYNKIIKRSIRRRYEATILSVVLMVIWNILGTCHIELPASIISELVLVVLQYTTYKRKFNPDNKKEEK